MEIQELLDRIDIVDLISEYTELKEQNGEYWGISPFTFPPEKTPSFSVRREAGKFFDFSSGLGGSSITFIKSFYNISSHEAIKWLQKYAGCEDEQIKTNDRLAATNVCKKYKSAEPTKKEKPPVNVPKNCMERYVIDHSKTNLWRDEGISQESLDKFGVMYDDFSDRIVYPIYDTSGKIVNVGGRTLDPDYKEKGLRKYTYFYSWGSMSVIYGLYENMKSILEKREVILFEGCKSVMLADTWGIHNCGALLTSHLSASQFKILIQLGVRVVFALDKEIDIKKDHNIERLKRYVNVEYLWDKDDLLGSKDAPVDKGKEVFVTLYENRLKYR